MDKNTKELHKFIKKLKCCDENIWNTNSRMDDVQLMAVWKTFATFLAEIAHRLVRNFDQMTRLIDVYWADLLLLSDDASTPHIHDRRMSRDERSCCAHISLSQAPIQLESGTSR